MMLNSLLQSISGHSILVIGDVMLDEYHWCNVSRISPEAPVPVCSVIETTHRPGGAGNVANNLIALGNTVSLMGVIGEDSSGEKLVDCFEKNGVPAHKLIRNAGINTILKSRIIAHHQHVVRVDRDNRSVIPPFIHKQLLAAITTAMRTADAVIISDYAKGLFTPKFTQAIIQIATAQGKPVIVDPKGSHYAKYRNATVITPNMHEFEVVTKHQFSTEKEVLVHASKLIKSLKIGALLVTRSEKGMTLVLSPNTKIDIPTHAAEVFDITGAGDTVVAVLAAAIAGGVALEPAVRLSNAAAGVVIGKIGTATTTLAEIERAIG